MENSKMVLEINGIVFVKYPKAGTVNVYQDGVNIDCFTNYEIGNDFEKFKESCNEYTSWERNVTDVNNDFENFLKNSNII